MTEKQGLDFQEDENGFVLSVTDDSGAVNKLKLSPEQVLILAQSAPLLRDRALSHIHPGAVGAYPAFVTPVAQIELNRDSLAEDIHLKMITPGGDWQVFALGAHLASELSSRLQVKIVELLASAPPARQ